MAVAMIGPKFYAWDRNGKPLAFGKVYTYQARTNSPKSTYQSEDSVVENTNPVILNGEGYANIYLDGSYKVVVKDKDENEIWTADPVTSASADEWVHCKTATYISSTSFKVGGNATEHYEPGRRVRIDNNTSAYSFSTIESSAFSSGETTIVILDAVVTTGVTESCVSIVSPQSFPNDSVLNFNTITGDNKSADKSNNVRTGDTINAKERTQGNGGSALWDVVPTSSVTPNGFNVIVSQANPDISFSLRITDRLNVLAVGAIADGSTDNTLAMQAAHDLGVNVYYPEGEYLFDTITMDTGGIVGDGKTSILSTTNTSTDDIITHNVKDPDSPLINERGFIFRDFYLRASTNSVDQKPSGNGIKAAATPPENENFTSIISNVTIKNLPSCIWTSLVTFLTIENCYFSIYKKYGIYMDMDDPVFQDNGDNGIINNWFFTNQAGSFSIKYRGGGGRICNNKINGGDIGLDISPLRSSSVMTVTGNSIENQGVNCIRFIVEGDTQAVAFGRMVFTGNQLNGAVSVGSAISLISTVFTTREVVITGNQIQHNAVGGAIDIRGIERFCITGNEIYSNNAATSGIYIETNTDEGFVGNNAIYGISGRNLQNNSLGVVTSDEVIGTLKSTLNLPSLNAGDSYSQGYAIGRAELGDQSIVTVTDASTVGLLITSQVYANGAVIVEVQNNSAGVINLGNVSVNIVVKAI